LKLARASVEKLKAKSSATQADKDLAELIIKRPSDYSSSNVKELEKLINDLKGYKVTTDNDKKNA